MFALIPPLKDVGFPAHIVKHTFVPRALRPVGEYLTMQKRYEHLFKNPDNLPIVKEIQDNVNRYWKAVAETEGFEIILP